MTTPTLLTEGELPTVETVLYTVPATSRLMLKDFDICNTTAGALLAYVYIVPPAGTPDASTMLVPGSQVEAGQMVQWTGTEVLEAGYMLAGKASGAGVNLRASGGVDRV